MVPLILGNSHIKPLCTTVGVQGNEPSKLKAKFGSLSSKSTASSCLIFAVWSARNEGMEKKMESITVG